MKTYGEEVISYDTCKVWFAKVKKGDFTFEDAPRSGRLSCWWSRKGMEHWELLEKGQTINDTMYIC